MAEKNSGCTVSLPFLALIFVILKLTGVISWSWVWVLSPVWIPILLVLGVLFLVLGVVLGLTIMGYKMSDIKGKIKQIKK